MHAPLMSHLKHRHNIGVMQLPSSLNFMLEAAKLARVEHGGERQDFERDAAAN